MFKTMGELLQDAIDNPIAFQTPPTVGPRLNGLTLGDLYQRLMVNHQEDVSL